MQGHNNPLSSVDGQRSHVLVVMSDTKDESGETFLDWYSGDYLKLVAANPTVLSAQHYEQHEVDVTLGRFERFPFKYLGLYDLLLDGAEEAEELMALIVKLHSGQPSAKIPVIWLYYPISERVGRSPSRHPSMLAIAFANPILGMELEFQEWYATRHLRHALQLPQLVSGQCFARALWQQKGSQKCPYAAIAIYEQEGSPESLLESANALPQNALDFPALDTSKERFKEWIYRPI